MPCENFVRISFNSLIILLFTVLLGLSASPVAAQNVTISWDQSYSGSPVLAYQLYQDNLLLCETSNPAAREITCPVVTEGRSVFSVVAVYGDGVPGTTVPGSGSTTPGTTTPDPTPGTTTPDPTPGTTTPGTTTPDPTTDPVTSVNHVPVANAGPDQVVNNGEIVTLDATNSYDIDNDPLTVSWVQLDGPTVSLPDPDALQPEFTAIDAGVAGATLSFQLTVTDAQGLESTDFCSVNIVWVNQPPVADAGVDQKVAEGDTVVLDASGSTDVDDGIASYSWVQLFGPATTLSDSTAMQPSFKAPDAGPAGASIAYEVTITDFGGLYTKDTVIINTAWINDPPVANAGGDQSIYAGDVVTLDGSLSYDADDGIATVQWLQKTGLPVTLSNPTALKPTFEAPADILTPVNLAFELLVTDYSGLQHTDSCIVEVLPLQQAVAGDLDGNGVLDSLDRRILTDALGYCVGDAAYLASADLNGDNCVTKTDVYIWRRYYRNM